ncbi:MULTISPECIES: heavy metal-binding domain-containing protein [Clostridium]|jgi:uncharacterized protein YbjQ (UPF0145 family)|uniref:UPF0145 protein CINTURNW_3915 n=3 Tax=Clostridium intestinale TaxID=36845 RepID=U2NIZ2_9CLOT|nr:MULTISPECIES: heavy metal-binding domain-containing protein [Clostridium]ERK28841.1 hypothetical protein CINTURNW_3915 [Clostridium intestinale URNW]QLY80199.1 heavy metal-binding domain-containing protein [Clostridium intestinale]WRY50865.1 heavy metal-binding domain-containing protein [Clostridium intestinale]SHI82401.1 Uncharacterized conserved protein YbjQ, UPF0145 family [Clostridium intestinale DSM 6191]
MIVTTTNNIEGKVVKEYLGVTFGEVITGVNFVKDFMAGIRDLVGGRSKTYEDELINARREAMEELKRRAASMGANAVIGIDVDYEVLGASSGMLMVTVSGTAVIVE